MSITQEKFNALALELARWVVADELKHGPGFERSTLEAAQRLLKETIDEPAAPARPEASTEQSQAFDQWLESGRYATVTGINLRHGERVKLLDYSRIDGRWYCELFNGRVVRYAPKDLTPEAPSEPPGNTGWPAVEDTCKRCFFPRVSHHPDCPER